MTQRAFLVHYLYVVVAKVIICSGGSFSPMMYSLPACEKGCRNVGNGSGLHELQQLLLQQPSSPQ